MLQQCITCGTGFSAGERCPHCGGLGWYERPDLGQVSRATREADMMAVGSPGPETRAADEDVEKPEPPPAVTGVGAFRLPKVGPKGK